MNQAIKQIAIIGSGIELQMTAAILSAALQSFQLKIVVLALPQSEESTLTEAAGPEFSALCQILGLAERDVIRQCQATFRLGNRYLLAKEDWFLPFAHLGVKAQQDDFEQGLFQVIGADNKANLSPWSAASSAAMAGKFAIAGNDRPDLRQALDYGVNLSITDYAKVLQAVHAKHNVEWHQLSKQTLVFEHDELGKIAKVTADKHTVTADFWFDLRSGQTAEQWQDWRSYLPISYRAQWQSTDISLQKPYVQLQKMDGGWLKTTPLRSSSVYQVFACGDKAQLTNIEQQLSQLKLEPKQTINWRKVNCGALTSPWQGNCLYLGKASIELGGLVFSELQCLQAALVQFIDMFPDLPIGEHNRRNYNSIWQRFVQDARDFSTVHFLTECDNLADYTGLIPGTLLSRMQVFERLGRLEPMHSDAVTEGQWYHLLFGLGLRPQLHSVVLSNMNEQQLKLATQRVAQGIAGLVAGMPSQEQYLTRFYPQYSTQ